MTSSSVTSVSAPFRLFLAIGSLSLAHAATVDVFFLAGQSNASGRVSSGYVSDPRDAQVQYYYRTDGPPANNVTSGGEFTTLGPLGSGFYGPEITMGRQLVDFGYNPAIIKVSDGGTSLAVDWNSQTSGPWWTNWQNDAAAALSELVADGDTPVLRGFSGCRARATWVRLTGPPPTRRGSLHWSPTSRPISVVSATTPGS